MTALEEPSAAASTPPAVAAVAPQGNAYKGLDYFEKKDAVRFAGRERDIGQIVARVTTSRAFVLYSRSGLGKTSLLLAGVVPELEPQHYQPVYVRTLADPLTDLFRAIHETCQVATSANLDLCELLTRAGAGGTVLLILDQFEEFFIRFKKQPKLRMAFVNALSRVILDKECDVRVIFSLREDYLAALDEFQRKLPDLFLNAYRLLPLSAMGALDAIVKPLRHAGMAYDERVVTRLVDELAAYDFDSARLQITCAELYEAGAETGRRLTEDDLEKLQREEGGLDGVFSRYLRAATSALEPGQHLLARTLFDVLMTRQDTKFAISESELESLHLAPPDELAAVLQVLLDKKIIRPEPRAGENWFELIHECLVPEIRRWLDGDDEFANYRLARDVIASNSRDGRFRDMHDLLLSKAALAQWIRPHRARLRLSPLQIEFVLWSAIVRGDAEVAYWLAAHGRESEPLLRRLLDDADVEMRTGAAAAAIHFPNSRPIIERCLALALDENENPAVQRATGKSLATIARPQDLQTIKARLRWLRTPRHIHELLADLEARNRVREVFGVSRARVARRLLERRFARANLVKIREARSAGIFLGVIAGLGSVISGTLLFTLLDCVTNLFPEKAFLEKCWGYTGPWMLINVALGAWLGARLMVTMRRVELLTGACSSAEAVRRSRLIFGMSYPVVALGLSLLALVGLFYVHAVRPLSDPVAIVGLVLVGLIALIGGWPVTAGVRKCLARAVELGECCTGNARPSGWLVLWTTLPNFAWFFALPITLVLTGTWLFVFFAPTVAVAEAASVAYLAALLLIMGPAFLHYIALFVLAGQRTGRLPVPAPAAPSATGPRWYAAAIIAALPLWFLAFYGAKTVPFAWFPGQSRQVVDGPLSLEASLPRWPQANYFFLTRGPKDAGLATGSAALFRLRRATPLQVVLDKHSLTREDQDVVLFAPSGRAEIAVGNFATPGETAASLTVQPVPFHTSEQMPVSDEVFFFPCRLEAEPSSSGSSAWIGTIGGTLTGYESKPLDKIEARLYQHGLLGTGSFKATLKDAQALAEKSTEPLEMTVSSGRSAVLQVHATKTSSTGLDLFKSTDLKIGKKSDWKAEVRLVPAKETTGLWSVGEDLSRKPTMLLVAVRLVRATAGQYAEAGDLAEKEQPKAAVNYYQMAAALDPRNAGYQSKVGLLLESQGDLDGALAWYRKAVALAPEDADLQNLLAWGLCQRKDFPEAWEVANRAVVLAPEVPMFWDTYAHGAFGTERWGEAVKGWENAKRLNPKFFEDNHDPLCRNDPENLALAWQKSAETPAPPAPAPVP